jgi:hypothetical protein
VTEIVRCPGCGALTATSWAKTHAPKCPFRAPDPREVLEVVRDIDATLDRLLALTKPENP